MKKVFSLVLTSILIAAAGCSSVQVDEKDPASLFKDAEAEIASDHYIIAIDKLRAIKNKFPYSSFAAESQLRIADVYYIQELFPEAAANYQAFKDLHPKNPKVPYAMLQIGKSYFRDAPTLIERDLSPLKKAFDAYQEYLSRYPDSPESTTARKEVGEIRKRLAEKELLIGDFYFRRELYRAAEPRYEKVVQNFPDTEEAKIAAGKIADIQKKPQAVGDTKNHGF